MLISVDTGWWLPPSSQGPGKNHISQARAEVGTLPGAWISASLFPHMNPDTSQPKGHSLLKVPLSAPVSESYDIVVRRREKGHEDPGTFKIKAALS